MFGPSIPDDANPFRDNPYTAPSPTGGPETPFAGPSPAAEQGKIQHVRIVAILMIIQGVLEGLMGLLLLAFAVGFPLLISLEEDAGAAGRAGHPPEELGWFIMAVYGALGGLTLAAATLHIVAGVRNYQFRGRVMGLVALAGGMATLMTCYCAPSAIGLAIYGLIVYLDPPVARAFDRENTGADPQPRKADVP